MLIEFQVNKHDKIRFCHAIKLFYWVESISKRNINIVCPMGMQQTYKDLAIEQGLATSERLYVSTKAPEKEKAEKIKKEKSEKRMQKPKGFFIKI
jgi:hypothetical protein